MPKSRKPLGGKKLKPEFVASVSGAAYALAKLLKQDGSGNVLAGIVGDNERGSAIAQAEALTLNRRGALIIDCDGMSANDLLFGVEEHPDGHKQGRGPLAMAVDEGRPVILENFAKLKRGTESVLHPLFMLLDGSLDKASFHQPAGVGESWDISRKDLDPNFRLRVTGIQGYTDEPSMSLNSRLTLVNPDATVIAASATIAPQPPKKRK